MIVATTVLLWVIALSLQLALSIHLIRRKLPLDAPPRANLYRMATIVLGFIPIAVMPLAAQLVYFGLYRRKVATQSRMTHSRSSQSFSINGEDDRSLDSGAWLQGGMIRYNGLIKDHCGSPDTSAAGGDERRQADDLASSLYFYQWRSTPFIASMFVATRQRAALGSGTVYE